MRQVVPGTRFTRKGTRCYMTYLADGVTPFYYLVIDRGISEKRALSKLDSELHPFFRLSYEELFIVTEGGTIIGNVGSEYVRSIGDRYSSLEVIAPNGINSLFDEPYLKVVVLPEDVENYTNLVKEFGTPWDEKYDFLIETLPEDLETLSKKDRTLKEKEERYDLINYLVR